MRSSSSHAVLGPSRSSLVSVCLLLVSLSEAASATDPVSPPLSAPPVPGSLIILVEPRSEDAPQLSVGYSWDGHSDRATKLFTYQRSPLCYWNRLGAFAVSRSGWQYYISTGNGRIIAAPIPGSTVKKSKDSESSSSGERKRRASSKEPFNSLIDERIYFTHTKSSVGDIALDEEDNIYFSEATGGVGDGRIFRLPFPEEGRPLKPELICTVRLTDLIVPALGMGGGGHWGGDFAFGRTEKGELDSGEIFLSSGGGGAAIYRISKMGDEWTKPECIFPTRYEPDLGNIFGVVCTAPEELYFGSVHSRNGANQLALYKLTNGNALTKVLTFDEPKLALIWDISVVPRSNN